MKSPLQIKHLHYLVVLSKERHFGRAANMLAISQPALSQSLQQLERHFGVPIVQRHQTGFEGLTAEGENILAWARQTIADHDRLVSETGKEHETTMRGSLRLSLALPGAPTADLLRVAPVAEHWNLAGLWVGDPRSLVVIGMAAVLTAATHAPLMAITMVLEMTNEFQLTVPEMLACAISYAISTQFGAT